MHTNRKRISPEPWRGLGGHASPVRVSSSAFVRVHPWFHFLLCVLCVSAVDSSLFAANQPTDFKKLLLPEFFPEIPKLLASQDKTTGHFGSGVWIVTDQNVLWPLAVAWSINSPDNPYYHKQELLTAILKGGDALIAAQDETGQWTFRKKDNSTWGQIYMPWTYSRWIRAYALTRDAMTDDQRARWDKAITLGVTGIIKHYKYLDDHSELQNIPAYNATGVYLAGQFLHHDDWCAAASKYLRRIAGAQDKDGFWTEHLGPVMNYNFVYVDALGLYYGMSHDKEVLPALEHAANYHANFVYPDGTPVETVDERNGYENSVPFGNVGFTFSDVGRGYLLSQYLKRKSRSEPAPVDAIASIAIYGQDGPGTRPDANANAQYIMGNNDALTARNGPWFLCLSAYHADLSTSRWIQDRQNFLSLFHQKTGLILGGGNSKLTPLWSTFTAGDTSLLFHKPGDEDPNFIPPKGLIHTPSDVKLDPAKNQLTLAYGDATCTVRVEFVDDRHTKITYALTTNSSLPIEAHIPLLVHMQEPWESARTKFTFTEQPFSLTHDQLGDYLSHHGCKITLPPTAKLTWPVLPHNQYVKDGSPKPAEGRAVITLPLGKVPSESSVEIEVN
jgi:hypothetical protein